MVFPFGREPVRGVIAKFIGFPRAGGASLSTTATSAGPGAQQAATPGWLAGAGWRTDKSEACAAF